MFLTIKLCTHAKILFEIELIIHIKMDLALNNHNAINNHNTINPTNQPTSDVSQCQYFAELNRFEVRVSVFLTGCHKIVKKPGLPNP